MNKEEKPVGSPPLTSKELQEDTRGGLKEDPAKPIHDLPPEKKEVVVSPNPKEDALKKKEKERLAMVAKEKLKKASPEDKSLHLNLTEAEITSVKVFHDRLVRIERMLEYLVIYAVTDLQKILPEPNIRDILAEIAANAKVANFVKEEKKDEVPTDS